MFSSRFKSPTPNAISMLFSVRACPTLLLVVAAWASVPFAHAQADTSAVAEVDNLLTATPEGIVFNLTPATVGSSEDEPNIVEVWRGRTEDGPFTLLGQVTASRSWAEFQSRAGERTIAVLEQETGLRGDALWAEIQANPGLDHYSSAAYLPLFAVAMGAAYLDDTANALPGGAPLVYLARYNPESSAPSPSPGVPEGVAFRGRVTSGPPVYPRMTTLRMYESDSLVSVAWGGSLAGTPVDPLAPPLAAAVYRQEGGVGPFERLPTQAGVRVTDNLDSLYVQYDDLVTPGHIYRYVARPFNRGFYEGTPTDTAAVVSGQFDSVPLLTNIRVEADSVGIRISWAPRSESYYRGVKIWRATDLDVGFAPLDTAATSAGTYLDRTAPAATTVYYQLLALTPRQNADVPQITVSGAWENRFAPPAPVGDIEVAVAGPDVEVRWTLPPDTSNVSGYRVLRSFGSPGNWDTLSLLLPTSTTAYRDTSSMLSGEAIYFYTVETMSRSGMDGFVAAPASIRPDRPVDVPPPLGLTALTDYGAVTLQWPSVTTRSDLADGYLVYRAERGGSLSRLSPDTLRTLTFTDTSAVAGRLYRYRVTTVAYTGDESSEGAETEATLPVTHLAPPSAIAWRAGADSVGVSWGVVVSDYLAGYTVLRRGLEATAFEMVATLEPDAIDWVDPTAPAGPVVYAVSARYTDGEEAQSMEALVSGSQEP